ncbi:MAG: permease prefix domain 1-containing protein [Fimbriimonas sp.]
MSTANDLLARLRRHSVDLEPSLRGALEAEIAAHLDAAIQARMELGESREEAEAGAVAAFGDVGKVVESIEEDLRPRKVSLSRPFLASLALFVIVTGFAVASRGPLGEVLAATMLGLMGIGAVVTWKTRCFQGRAFLFMALPACLVGTVAMATLYINPTLGTSRIERTTYDERLAFQRKSVRVNAAYLANLEAAYIRFQREGGLRTPRDFDRDTGAVIYRKARDLAFARRSWQGVKEMLPEAREIQERERRWLVAMENARGRSWLAEIPYELDAGAMYALSVLGWFAVPHLLVLFLRWLVDEVGRTRRRSRRRRGTA